METVQPQLIRIREIVDVQPFRVICRWPNGDIRVNDFTNDILRWQQNGNPYLTPLANHDIVKTAFAPGGTIAFASVLVDTGEVGLQPLDLDPDVLFAESKKLEQTINEPVS